MTKVTKVERNLIQGMLPANATQMRISGVAGKVDAYGPFPNANGCGWYFVGWADGLLAEAKAQVSAGHAPEAA